MAEAVREQALATIVTKLQGMTGARPWGGTYPNAPVVERVLKAIAQVNQFPHLAVVEASGSTLEIRSSAGGQAIYEHGFVVTVYGYVKGNDLVTRSTWLQRLWDDVVRTLLGAATLDGLARDLVIGGDFDTDEGQLGDLGGFAQDVTVMLNESLTVG